MTRSFRALSIAMAFAIPAVALFLGVGGRAPTQEEILWTDLPWYFTPTFAVLHRALAEGFFPLWNPWQLAGWPFLAAFQTQVLYAPAWALAWLPPHLAVTAYNCVHWAWAFLGMTTLVTTLGLGRPAALAAASVFALSPEISSAFFTHSAGLAVCSWLPWCAAAAVKAARGSRPAAEVMLLACTLAMALLAGGPEHFFYLTGIVVVVGLWQALAEEPRRVPAAGLRIGAAFALCALLSAAQLLPTLELMSHAVRSAGTFEASYISRFHVETAALLRSVSGLSSGPAFLSVLFLPLLLCGLASKQTRRPTLVLLLFGLFVLDYLRGTEGWCFPLVHRFVPFVSGFRTLLRAAFAWSFFGALLVAFGTQALVDSAFLRGRPQLGRVVVAGLLLLLCVDAGARQLVGRPFVLLHASTTIYGKEGLAKALAEAPGPDRMYLHYGPTLSGLQHKFGNMHGVRQVSEYDALVPARYPKFFRVPPQTPWMGRLQFKDRVKDVAGRKVTVPGVKIADLDLLATRYYLAEADVGGRSWLETTVRGVTRFRGSYVLVERPEARPRAYLVHDVVGASSDDEALRILQSPGLDAATKAVVTGASVGLEPPLPGSEEQIRLTRDEPGLVEMEVECSSRCLAVLTDLAFPGWTATVDGKEAAILTANYMLRGLELPAGKHLVSFAYLPASFVAGASVSLLTGLAMAAVAIRARRRNEDDGDEAAQYSGL